MVASMANKKRGNTKGDQLKPLQLHVKIISAALIALGVVYNAFDWSRLWTGLYISDPAASTLKIVSSLLLGLITWTMTPRDSMDKYDAAHMGGLFVLVVAHDIFMQSELEALGMALFAVFLVLLSLRNLKGALPAWRKGKLATWRISTAISWGATLLGGYLYFLLPNVSDRAVAATIAAYCAALFVASISGVVALEAGVWPEWNAKQMVMGLGVLVLAGMTVGVTMALPQGPKRTVATSTTWLLYGPAMAMIASSAYKRPKIVW